MCVGDLSNAVGSAQIHAGLSKHALGMGCPYCYFRPGLGTSSGEHALRDGPSLPLGALARVGCGSFELVEIFQMRFIARRFTPVCRSRCGTRGRSAAPAPGGSYGRWDHSPCVWFLVCGPIETTFSLGVWDQQRRARSECECECELVRECECECECECGCACYCECACECECEYVSGIFQMRWVARRFTPVCRSRCGAGGVPAPGGSYGTWDHSPCVWLCLCRRIETTLPTVVWDQQRNVNVH